MSAVKLKEKRDDLFREISNVIRQWPDLEREIFDQAHYQGRSPEIISDTLKLDVVEVGSILRKCDRELLSSLREFRQNSDTKDTLISNASSPAA